MQISSAHQKKWKFPRPLVAASRQNAKFTKYQCNRKRGTYFLEFAIIVAFILVSSLVNNLQIMQTIGCNPIPKPHAPTTTKLEKVARNDDCSQLDKNKSSVEFVASSSNERKPTRLDANENELVQIEGLSSQPLSKISPDLSQQHATNEQQIMSPHVDRVLHAETFQANDLVNLLDLQQEHHHQNQQHQPYGANDESYGDYLNANTRRRARSIHSEVSNNFGSSNGLLNAETDIPDSIPNNDNINSEFYGEQQDDNSDRSTLASAVLSDPSQTEREAQASSQADFVNRLAMEDQQRKQNEMQTAQAHHVARAIKDQQAALTRQHDILMKQQLDEALNDSDNDRAWRRSLAEGSNRRISGESTSSSTNNGLMYHPSDTIYFSDQLDNNLSPNTSGFQLGESNSVKSVGNLVSDIGGDADYDDDPGPAEASNNDESYDLAPAAQHHSYGAHYGALHNHQGKYYQSVESHKKGQYKSAYKRGNKKFTISGHAHQHGSHASGHVKWHSKKGKGSHHWDLKHKDKKHHHHHHHY